MDMTPQTAWLLAISAVVIVGVVAFFIGRRSAGTKARIDALEAELSSKQAEVDGYRKEVEQHFDQTATLFVAMAGSYKEMFEHLSSGYEKLSSGSARALFQQRVDALLLGAERHPGATGAAGKLLGGAAAGAAAAAAAAPGVEAVAAETAQPARTTAPEPATEGATEGATEVRAEPAARSEPTLNGGAGEAAPAFQADAKTVAAADRRELEAGAADESDERVRQAEGIAFDPAIDEAPARSEAPRSEPR